jgi:hypothetical protein
VLSDKFFYKNMAIIVMMMMVIIIIIISTICTFVSKKDITVRIPFMSIFTEVQLATS